MCLLPLNFPLPFPALYLGCILFLLEEIAEYESKERCIEVLDEIEKICGQYLYAEGSLGLLVGSEAMPPMAAVIPRVYQMPEK